MKISEILNNPQNVSANAQIPLHPISQPASPFPLDAQDETSPIYDPTTSQSRAAVGASTMTGNTKVTALNRVPSITAPSDFSDPLQAQVPNQSGHSTNLTSAEMQSNMYQDKSEYNDRDSGLPAHPNSLPAVLPPVPQQQTSKIRLRADTENLPHKGPHKRARRNTADQSAHSQSDYPDSPHTSASSDYGQWAPYPSSNTKSSSRGSGTETSARSSLVSEPTMVLDQHGNPIEGAGDLSTYWKADGTRNDSAIPKKLPPPPGRSAGSGSSPFIAPMRSQNPISKSASIYPEPTLASVASMSSAGSSAWHSINGGSSYMNFPAAAPDDSMATPKLASLPPPPALRRPTVPKPIPTRVATAPPLPFRRRTTSASELLDHPQIRAALQKHKELSWKALQEQVGGIWEPKSETKVVFGEGAPANLMKRYSATEILDPDNWGRASRTDDASAHEQQQRIWFQVRPQMKGANEVQAFSNLSLDSPEAKPQISGAAGEAAIDEQMHIPDKPGHDKLVSASKELMVKQLFPKYEPYVPGLPAGAIYLRHDHDRFEYRPYGWGRREDYEKSENSEPPDVDPQTRALVKTPGGTLGGRFIAPNNRRLLQWSLAQARWLFVLSEAPSMERPKLPGGYSTPDRLNSFLQQGEVIQRLDGDETSACQWEWVLPIRRKLWVSPMEEIVKKCGPNAAPIWDLGGRMFWDGIAGQWKFEVGSPTREVRETIKDKDGLDREVVFDVCDGGRPRLAWDDFVSAREYLIALQRKIAKLKMRARERNAIRMPSSGTLHPPVDTHIKKEEDSESNMSGSVSGDVDVAMKEEGSDTGPRHNIPTDDGQKSAASLLNMMMSVGTGTASTRTLIATKPAEEQENAMDLDLGLHGSVSSLAPPIGRNNGFGEIDSGSPALSPTASHASTAARSISVDDDYDSPSGNG